MKVEKHLCRILNIDIFPLALSQTSSSQDDLDQRIAESPLTVEEPEPITEQDSDETMDGLQTPPPVVRQDSSESDEYEVWQRSCCVICHVTQTCLLSYGINSLTEPLISSIFTIKETWDVSGVIKAAMASASMLASSTSSLDKDDDEEDDDFDDESDEFSFYRFSVLHFQGSASHSHIIDRIKLPLLSHDDEGDALVRGWRKKIS